MTSNGGATVTLSDNSDCGTIAGGHAVLVTATRGLEPGHGRDRPDAVTVSTSSDTLSAQTNTYAITAAQAVSSPLITLTTTAAGATNVTYDVRFTTSPTGALAPYYSTITLNAPTGTDFTADSTYTIYDVTTGTNCGLETSATSNGGATVTVNPYADCGTIAGGDTVQVTATGVSNPASTSTGNVVTVSTSSDTLSAQTNTYAMTAAKAVSSPLITLSTTAAGATNVTYTASFTTSSTGALAPYYSTITLAAPTGTNFGSSSFTIEDLTTGTNCALENSATSNNGATATVSPYSYCGTIAAGDAVLVTASDVTNPGTATTGETVTVSTSSDSVSATTNAYAITAANAVSSPTIALSTTAAGATNVIYNVRFTTSSTGALAPSFSTITLTAPAGTNFGTSTSYAIEDPDTATSCSYDDTVTSNAGATLTLSPYYDCSIAAGDTVLVTANGVSNPTGTSTGNVVSVSTSSDTVPATTNTYPIGGGAQTVASPLVTLSSPAAGASNVTYTATFSTSSTGSLADGPRGRSPWPLRPGRPSARAPTRSQTSPLERRAGTTTPSRATAGRR